MASGIEVFMPVSHTLFDPADIINKNGGRPPLTYQSFMAIAGEPPAPIFEEYSELPPVGDTGEYELLPVPTVEELGYGDISQEEIPPFRGETEALRRMKASLQDKEWVAKFEKPKGDPSAFSTGGRIISDHRTRLSGNTVEGLICFQDWLRESGSSYLDIIKINNSGSSIEDLGVA